MLHRYHQNNHQPPPYFFASIEEHVYWPVSLVDLHVREWGHFIVWLMCARSKLKQSSVAAGAVLGEEEARSKD